MDVHVDVKAEDVQSAVVKAIMDSALGASLREAVNKAVNEKKGWNSASLIEQAVDDVLRKEISNLAQVMILERKEVLHKMVSDRLTDAALAKFVDKTWEMFMNSKDR